MKRLSLLLISIIFAVGHVVSKPPKWYKKATKAQITVITYDKDGNILKSGSGFFISADGCAVADYSLFEKAYKAKAVTADGKECDVTTIEGANSLYDVVKFKVATKKSTPYLTIANHKGTVGEHIYILPYPTQKDGECIADTIQNIQTFNEQFGYYTINRQLGEKYINTPVMTAEGEVLAMIQRGSDNKAKQTFAISSLYARSLKTESMSPNNNDLKNIHIRKAIPADEDEAYTFMFMATLSGDSVSYQDYLDAYVAQFPNSCSPYIRRMEYYINNNEYEAAETDVNTAIENCDSIYRVYYAFSKMLHTINSTNDSVAYKDWNLNKSLEMIRQAISLKPDPLYIMHEAQVLFSLKQYDEAKDKFLSLKNTNMHSGDIYLYAAECLRMSGADTLSILALQDSAVGCYKKPYLREAAKALLQRADTYAHLGRYREAVADMYDYEKAVGGNLGAVFYYQRYYIEKQCRMYQHALNDIDRAISLSSASSELHLERAVLCYTVGETEEAITSAQKCIELTPDYADAYRILAICQLEAGQRDAAIANLQKSVELGDEIAKELLEEEQGRVK